MVEHTALGTWQNHLIPLSSLYSKEGSSFPGCVPPDNMFNSESVVGVKPGGLGMVIVYQADEFIHPKLADYFCSFTHLC